MRVSRSALMNHEDLSNIACSDRNKKKPPKGQSRDCGKSELNMGVSHLPCNTEARLDWFHFPKVKHQDQYTPVEQYILGFLCASKTKMTWDTVPAFSTLLDTFRDVHLACNHTMRTSSRPVTGRSGLEDGTSKVVELWIYRTGRS